MARISDGGSAGADARCARILHRLLIVAVVSSGLMTGAAAVSAYRSDLDRARQALGVRQLPEVLVEFEYASGIGTRGAAGAKARGTGRILYRYPASYRLEFFRRTPYASHQVSQEHQGVFTRFWTRGGRTEIVDFDALGLASARKRLQREMMVYLSALLLAEVPFLTYEAHGDEYVVSTVRGSSARFALQDLQVSRFRYERARAVPIVLAPGVKPVTGPERMQPAVARVADFRPVGQGRLPHVLQSTHGEGWENLTIRRYVLKGGVTDDSFAVPRARN